jgi:hypothetical protein
VVWNDRVVYAKEGYLYISNKNNPTKVPNVNPATGTEDYWGWPQVAGDNGKPVVALGVWPQHDLSDKAHEFIVIFKRGGVWLAWGQTQATFDMKVLPFAHGCLSQETVAIVGQHMLWLDKDMVCAIIGDTPFEIGLPIKGALEKIPLAYQQQARAVVDSVRSLYLLVVPTATAATAFICDLSNPKKPEWWQWNGAEVDPPTVVLIATPDSVDWGNGTRLTWYSTDATGVVSSDFGAAAVTDMVGQLIYPIISTTYNITVSGPGGTASASAMVSVISP